MNSAFQLIDSGWEGVFSDALALNSSELCMVCPFIKLRTAERLILGAGHPSIRVITRFNLDDMYNGVNDTSALRLMLEHGAKIRGVKGLHAKLYLFGDQRVIMASANLTEAALFRNHEFGFAADDQEVLAGCRDYFEKMWDRAGGDLTVEKIDTWEAKIMAQKARGGVAPLMRGLGDEGTDTNEVDLPAIDAPPEEPASQGFVKFLGEGDNRADIQMPILDELRGSGCHWALCYPQSRRPRQVQDGDRMFMGRLVWGPNDTIIFGRATAMRHVEIRDEATDADIALRDWKETWCNYVRVHDGEFINGPLQNGIRLSALMDALGAESFESTQRNARAGDGNTDPRKAFQQKPSVQLTSTALQWLNERFESALATHERIPEEDMAALDWPLPLGEMAAFVMWLQANQKKSNTAREYAYFLNRCTEHYEEVSLKTVPDLRSAEQMIERLRSALRQRGKWTARAFDERDISQNVAPALRAFGRFAMAQIPHQTMTER